MSRRKEGDLVVSKSGYICILIKITKHNIRLGHIYARKPGLYLVRGLWYPNKSQTWGNNWYRENRVYKFRQPNNFFKLRRFNYLDITGYGKELGLVDKQPTVLLKRKSGLLKIYRSIM